MTSLLRLNPLQCNTLRNPKQSFLWRRCIQLVCGDSPTLRGTSDGGSRNRLRGDALADPPTSSGAEPGEAPVRKTFDQVTYHAAAYEVEETHEDKTRIKKQILSKVDSEE
ncbi:hypothetical protein DY000_02062263 [Brassica cretica]|uniref:Uncharacterized protein n=1 Tax=Brassica cretica TaxID=69181 RepID=A0ABQ7AN69_BRACR|nr:hypothetical protein DY000_02062263 [Brassica cretica]